MPTKSWYLSSSVQKGFKYWGEWVSVVDDNVGYNVPVNGVETLKSLSIRICKIEQMKKWRLWTVINLVNAKWI